jgi:hypothetical protein
VYLCIGWQITNENPIKIIIKRKDTTDRVLVYILALLALKALVIEGIKLLLFA